MASCDTDIESKPTQNPYTYSDLYYQNLRDYKASDHAIAFGWFSQYGPQNSLAVRFMGLPDSLDICSMWGGIPAKERTDIWKEIRFVQKVKGTKMLAVAITRIDAEMDKHDFKKAYLKAKAMPEGEEKNAAINRAIEMYAEHFLDQIFQNDLDGFDADYEPEGDFLQGPYFIHFMQHLAKYMGPNPNITKEERLALIQERYGKGATDTNKMLCVDGGSLSALAPVCNYFFQQTYGGAPGNVSGWPSEKVVYCANVGDNWQTATVGNLYTYARYQPATGRKGGFGAFLIHRDYNVHENNPYPYKRFNECIQIQNPAVY
jgi:hypothetical protein